MRIGATFAGLRAMVALCCLLALAGGDSLAQSPAGGQLPSNPQPQASSDSPAAPQTQRNAPSASPASAPVEAQAALVIPASAERHYHAGRAAEKDKDYDSAISEFRAAIKDYPDYVDARYRLADLLMDRQGYTDAVAQLRQRHLGQF